MAVLLPANGFPPATYRPFLDMLGTHLTLACLPPRGLWPGVGPPTVLEGSWTELANDLLEGCECHAMNHFIGIGHSFGAIAMILAALQQPERFAGLVLLDPTLPPAPGSRAPAMTARAQHQRSALVEKALKRRNHFSSSQDAYRYFREKELFADWSDTAVAYYAHGVLGPNSDGSGHHLAWSPVWEAYYYRSFSNEIWSQLPSLDPTIPLLVLAGDTSAVFPSDRARLISKLLPHGTHVSISGYGHLFPHAAPEPTTRLIRRWLHTFL